MCSHSQLEKRDARSLQHIYTHFCLRGNECLFMWGAYFCMGAYNRDVLVVIKMGAYIHGGAYYLWVPIILILTVILL